MLFSPFLLKFLTLITFLLPFLHVIIHVRKGGDNVSREKKFIIFLPYIYICFYGAKSLFLVSTSSARFVLIRRLIMLSSKTLYKCWSILAWGAIVSKIFLWRWGVGVVLLFSGEIAMKRKKMCRKKKFCAHQNNRSAGCRIVEL